MTHEEREEYIRQAKKSFHSDNIYQKNKLDFGYGTNDSENTNGKRVGYWKIRIIISIVLFVGFFSYFQAKTDKSQLVSSKIFSMIEKDVDKDTVQAWFQQEKSE